MRIYQIKTKPHGILRIEEFLNDGIIAIGFPGIGNLFGASKNDIKVLLKNVYGLTGQSLNNSLGVVNTFMN